MARMRHRLSALSIFFLCCAAQLGIAFAAPGSDGSFEGRITATLTRRGQAETVFYTVGTNEMRIERGEAGLPYPVDIFDCASGELTLLFPNNHSFVRVRAPAENQPGAPGFPAMPMPMPNMAMPPGMGAQAPPLPPSPAQIPGIVGPTNLPSMPQMPPGVGPQSAPLGGAPALPSMPMMPPMPPMMMDKMELKATADSTNLLGYPCIRYELKQRGEVMEIWATDKLFPFQPYLQNQPRRFGSQMMDEQWAELLKAKKLFPLLAVSRFETPSPPGSAATPPPPGPERMRFEVQSIAPEEITDETLFQPPPDYQEIRPLPF